MDIKAKIEEIVQKITKDPEAQALFTKDPVKAVEKVVGVDLPDDQLKPIVDGVKAKLAGDKLSGALGAIGGLLGK